MLLPLHVFVEKTIAALFCSFRMIKWLLYILESVCLINIAMIICEGRLHTSFHSSKFIHVRYAHVIWLFVYIINYLFVSSTACLYHQLLVYVINYLFISSTICLYHQIFVYIINYLFTSSNIFLNHQLFGYIIN